MKKRKRNFNHINHYVAEVRRLAGRVRPRLRGESGGILVPLTKTDIRNIFCREMVEYYFNEEPKMTPAEALSEELGYWE